MTKCFIQRTYFLPIFPILFKGAGLWHAKLHTGFYCSASLISAQGGVWVGVWAWCGRVGGWMSVQRVVGLISWAPSMCRRGLVDQAP